MNTILSKIRDAWLASFRIKCLPVLVLAFAGGCSTNGKNDDPRLYGADVYLSQGAQVMEYLIGPSDRLTISVWNRQELNQSVMVRPDGRISFPLVGDIYAVGITPEELQKTLETELGEYIDVIPGEVSVVVNEVHSYKVSVLGEVRLPGRFEFHNQVSVLDALAEAGGFTEFASKANILILRPYQGETEKIPFNYDRMVRAGANGERVLVFPGDVILVP